MTDLLTRQRELEYDSVFKLGAARYDKARANGGESATKPGQVQTDLMVPALAAAIDAWVEHAAKPEAAGRKHRAVPYLAHVLPEQAAYLTVRFALDAAVSNKKVNTVAIAIGTALEDHLNLVTLDVEAPGLYRKVMEQVKKSTSARHKTGVLRNVVRKYTKDRLTWSNTDKLHIGVKLLELLEESTTVITLRRDTDGRHNTPIKVVFTPEAEAWFAIAHNKARLCAPVHQPMLVSPTPWTSPFDGGYLTRAIRRSFMVATRVDGALREMDTEADLSAVFAAVNAVQATPWRINKALLAVMTEAREVDMQYLFAQDPKVKPARPASFAENVDPATLAPGQREELSLWKEKAAAVYAHNAAQKSKRAAAFQQMDTANTFKDEAAIYFPHYLDFRGRIYPFASYLNPQSSDHGRALLEFAEGKALGQRGMFWLKVHVANLFGVDKVSFEERVAWVNENLAALLDSAALPFDGARMWMTADKGKNRWQALAACMELAGAVVQGEDYVSHLPIAMDGSCSGLQHYSAMLRDHEGGKQVNLVPAARPGDIYSEVARRAQAAVDGSTDVLATPWKGGKVTRAIVKQPTMTMCYSATQFGMQKQIADAVKKMPGGEAAYLSGAPVKQSCAFLASVVWTEISKLVKAASEAMAFMREVAATTTEAGTSVRWTSPAGFRVVQEYREQRGKRVNLHYKGERIDLMVTEAGDRIDPKKQSAGIAPNFVHSLDSAHLMATVNVGTENGLTSWACIHDSFGVHACDVDTLHACIRETFIEQYTPDVLARFREEIVAQLPPALAEKVPPVPDRGTLDLEAVREAAYFFA
jgi:DNA-directed RNA polymerase, mitochondrial